MNKPKVVVVMLLTVGSMLNLDDLHRQDLVTTHLNTLDLVQVTTQLHSHLDRNTFYLMMKSSSLRQNVKTVVLYSTLV